MQDLIEKPPKSEMHVKPQSFWNPSDKSRITQALTVIINSQKAYGRDASVRDVFAYFQLKLDGRFSADQVLAALELYTDRKNDIPAPADLIALMTPAEQPRITATEFIHAKEQHAIEGYPAYGYYAMIIKQYERENADAQAKPVAPVDARIGSARSLADVVKQLT